MTQPAQRGNVHQQRHEHEPQQRHDYELQHVRDALADDPRVSELDVHLRMVGEAVLVTGHASTPQRRDAIPTVVTELLPGVEVRNEVTVPPSREPEDEEVVQ